MNKTLIKSIRRNEIEYLNNMYKKKELVLDVIYMEESSRIKNDTFDWFVEKKCPISNEVIKNLVIKNDLDGLKKLYNNNYEIPICTYLYAFLFKRINILDWLKIINIEIDPRIYILPTENTEILSWRKRN